MSKTRQWTLRLCLLALVTALPAIDASSPAATPPPTPTLEQTAGLPPEVRIRKLHLVRPDLIPYPIAAPAMAIQIHLVLACVAIAR